jgi:hypothetical protein
MKLGRESSGAKKQSPAGACRAEKRIDQIAKIVLRPFHILETRAPSVKRTARSRGGIEIVDTFLHLDVPK